MAVFLFGGVAHAQVQAPTSTLETGLYAEYSFPNQVVFVSSTPGSTIKYGYNEEMPSENSGVACQNSGACAVPILNRCGMNMLNVIAFKYEGGVFVASNVVEVEYDLYQVLADDPVVMANGYFTGGMNFEYGEELELHMISPDGNILRFTTDGSEPYGFGTMCSGDCFTLLSATASTTLKLNACRDHCPTDPACSDTVIINFNCVYLKPIISPSDEYYFDSPIDVLIDVYMNEVVRYTTDGTDPIDFGVEITSASQFTLYESAMVRAVRKKGGCGWSAEKVRNYVVQDRPVIDPPVVDLPSGQYSVLETNVVSITWNHETHYTLDGSFPDCYSATMAESSPEVIQLPAECGPIQLKLVSCSFEYNPPIMSELVESNYEIVLPAPVVSHEPGTYDISFDLSLSDNPSTPTHAFYYTCDGSPPWPNGIGYLTRNDFIPIREFCDLQISYTRPSNVSATCGQHSEIFRGNYDVSGYSWRAIVEGLLSDSSYSIDDLNIAFDPSSMRMGFVFRNGNYGGYYVDIELTEFGTSSYVMPAFAANTLSKPPQLFIVNGDVFVAYLDINQDLYLKMLDGNSWVPWPGQTGMKYAENVTAFDIQVFSDGYDNLVAYLAARDNNTTSYHIDAFLIDQWYSLITTAANAGSQVSLFVQKTGLDTELIYVAYSVANQYGGQDVAAFYFTNNVILTNLPSFTVPDYREDVVKSLDIVAPLSETEPTVLYLIADIREASSGSNGLFEGISLDSEIDLTGTSPAWATTQTNGYSFPESIPIFDDDRLAAHPWGPINNYYHTTDNGPGVVRVKIDGDWEFLECTHQDPCYQYVDQFVAGGSGKMDMEFIDFGAEVIPMTAFVDTRHDGGVTIRVFEPRGGKK